LEKPHEDIYQFLPALLLVLVLTGCAGLQSNDESPTRIDKVKAIARADLLAAFDERAESNGSCQDLSGDERNRAWEKVE